jgi:hypothetical protein
LIFVKRLPADPVYLLFLLMSTDDFMETGT